NHQTDVHDVYGGQTLGQVHRNTLGNTRRDPQHPALTARTRQPSRRQRPHRSPPVTAAFPSTAPAPQPARRPPPARHSLPRAAQAARTGPRNPHGAATAGARSTAQQPPARNTTLPHVLATRLPTHRST